MLVTCCCQPGVRSYGSRRLLATQRYPLRNEAPSAQILLVSRAVYDEAHSILYSNNTFTVACTPDVEWHAWDTFAQEDLARDVGKIFATDQSSLPIWLFPILSENEFEDDYIEKESSELCIDYESGLGYQFPAFLRQIGQLNAANIQRVELLFTDLTHGVADFSVYAEILRQHVPHLRKLQIDFEWLDDYGSDCGWDEPSGGRNGWHTEGRDEWTDDAVIKMFTQIRSLVKAMPTVVDLRFFGCPSSFAELGEAIIKEKYHGTVFDMGNLWKDLTPFRDSFGSGYGHPFPHPNFTCKDRGPEAFEKFKAKLEEEMLIGREEKNNSQLGQQRDQQPT